MQFLGVRTDLACAVGVDKSILITYIVDGVVKNKKNKKDELFQEGEWWFTRSLHDIADDLPFWTEKKISKELIRLRKEKIVVAKKLYVNNVNPPLSYRVDYNILGALIRPYIQDDNLDEEKEDEK